MHIFHQWLKMFKNRRNVGSTLQMLQKLGSPHMWQMWLLMSPVSGILPFHDWSLYDYCSLRPSNTTKKKLTNLSWFTFYYIIYSVSIDKANPLVNLLGTNILTTKISTAYFTNNLCLKCGTCSITHTSKMDRNYPVLILELYKVLKELWKIAWKMRWCPTRKL